MKKSLSTKLFTGLALGLGLLAGTAKAEGGGGALYTMDNAAAGNLTLNEDEIAALDRAFPRGLQPRSLPML